MLDKKEKIGILIQDPVSSIQNLIIKSNNFSYHKSKYKRRTLWLTYQPNTWG